MAVCSKFALLNSASNPVCTLLKLYSQRKYSFGMTILQDSDKIIECFKFKITTFVDLLICWQLWVIEGEIAKIMMSYKDLN